MDQNKKDIFQRELSRKSQDRIRVINPTDQDYRVSWDGYLHSIPARGEAILPRYIAEKYIKEMTTKVLIEWQDMKVKEENEKRKGRGEKAMDKWAGGDQDVFEGLIRFQGGVDDADARRQVMKKLYGGLVEEYGLDVKPERPGKKDSRSIDEMLLAEIQSEVVEEVTPELPLKDKSVFELQKVARDKGVEFAKTDKKDELIAKIAQ